MSVLNNSLFRIFRDVVYCSVINVLRCCSRDSSFRLSHLSSLVNNFFNLFFTVLCDSFVSRDSFVRISPLQLKVNTFFTFFSCFSRSTISHKNRRFPPPVFLLLICFYNSIPYTYLCEYKLRLCRILFYLSSYVSHIYTKDSIVVLHIWSPYFFHHEIIC